MKRFSLFLLFILLVGTCSMAATANRKTYLPKRAQTFIRDYWPRTDMIESYRDKGAYVVNMDGGTTLRFDRNGKWFLIENPYGFPTHFLPDSINEFIHKQYPSSYIARVTRHDKGYTVVLNTGLELRYTKQGYIMRVDD